MRIVDFEGFFLKKNQDYDIILFCRQWQLKNMKKTKTIGEQKKEKNP